MRKYLVLMSVALISCGVMTAKEARVGKVSNDTIIVVSVNPPMHCVNCEKKIKSNIRFVKGVKKIETDLDKQTVTITADKTKVKTAELDKAFSKIGYRMNDASADDK